MLRKHQAAPEVPAETDGLGRSEPLRRRVRARVVRALTPVASAELGGKRRRPPLRALVGSGRARSYRFAAFSHEFRNLRKSSRVSLSAASCARAAHSAAFCLQYPVFSCMTVSALELAALSISRQEPSSAKARRFQLPRTASGSNAEGGQSEACPPVNRH